MQAHTLTDRQERFVFEYLKDQNASAAAARAGYAEKSRAAQAGELMQNPAVRERVRMELQGLLAELGASALDLMKERKRAGFFRAGRLFGADGELLGFAEMEAEVRDALVISVVWRRGEPVIHWRMPNREPALRALERVHERLERLNEAHYAKMEREARAGPADFAGKPMVLSGSEPAVANTFVFSGVPEVTDPPASVAIAERHQVLSGSGDAAGNTSVLPTAAETTAAPPAAFEFAQKPMVLSGSPQAPVRPSVFARAMEVFSPNKKGVTSVVSGEGRLPLRGAATELLSRGAYNDSSQKYNSPRVR